MSQPSVHTSQEAVETVEVRAPVWRVYEAWSHLERFSEFFQGLHHVERLGQGRYRWEASLLPGFFSDEAMTAPQTEWFCSLVRDEPNTLVAWESVCGELCQSGEVNIQALSPNHTRVQLRVAYHLGAGQTESGQGEFPTASPAASGECLQRVVVDPQQQLREDLARFKTLLERETLTPRSPETPV